MPNLIIKLNAKMVGWQDELFTSEPEDILLLIKRKSVLSYEIYFQNKCIFNIWCEHDVVKCNPCKTNFDSKSDFYLQNSWLVDIVLNQQKWK